MAVGTKITLCTVNTTSHSQLLPVEPSWPTALPSVASAATCKPAIATQIPARTIVNTVNAQ